MATQPDPPEGGLGPWIRGDAAGQQACGEADGYADAQAGKGWPDGYIDHVTPYTRGYANGRSRYEAEQEKKDHA